MAANRPPKKNGTIEIRLPDAAKTAFMERCRQDDQTASEAIRAFIAERLDAPVLPPQRPVSWRVAIAALIGALMGIGIAAPSLAHARQNSRMAFDQLDRNHDGVLSYAEYRGR